MRAVAAVVENVTLLPMLTGEFAVPRAVALFTAIAAGVERIAAGVSVVDREAECAGAVSW